MAYAGLTAWQGNLGFFKVKYEILKASGGAGCKG